MGKKKGLVGRKEFGRKEKTNTSSEILLKVTRRRHFLPCYENTG